MSPAEDHAEEVVAEAAPPAKPKRRGRRPKKADSQGPLYVSHFGLREAPFGITPDTEFIYATRSHQEGLNTLLVALRSGEGFIKITGEVGTGKTLLCRRLLKSLDDEQCVTAYLPNPGLSPQTLLRTVADELGRNLDEGAESWQLLKALNEALLEFAGSGKTVIVLLDEAQAIPIEALETLRLLSNLETEKRKLLQIVMFGQPELDVHLSNPAIRQLKQRIAFSFRLQGMRREELRQYLQHRLRTAGMVAGELFSDDAVRALYATSRGTPRLINILANKSLLLVFGEGGQMVRGKHVRAAARDTEGAFRPWIWW
jgi:MSHA biogenesis protein MshM